MLHQIKYEREGAKALAAAWPQPKTECAAKARKREGRREEERESNLNSYRLPSFISRDFLFSQENFWGQRFATVVRWDF